jgi:hypothetical protein
MKGGLLTHVHEPNADYQDEMFDAVLALWPLSARLFVTVRGRTGNIRRYMSAVQSLMARQKVQYGFVWTWGDSHMGHAHMLMGAEVEQDFLETKARRLRRKHDVYCYISRPSPDNSPTQTYGYLLKNHVISGASDKTRWRHAGEVDMDRLMQLAFGVSDVKC